MELHDRGLLTTGVKTLQYNCFWVVVCSQCVDQCRELHDRGLLTTGVKTLQYNCFFLGSCWQSMCRSVCGLQDRGLLTTEKDGMKTLKNKLTARRGESLHAKAE